MKSLTIKQENKNTEGGYLQQWLYSDGAEQVRLTPDGVEAVQSATDITVIASIKSSADIVNLVMLGDAVTSTVYAAEKETPVNLVLPYYPYARADRRFKLGDCFGLRKFEQMLEIIDWASICTFDKHSDVTCLPNLVNVSPWPTIQKIILEMNEQRLNVLLPDKGASTRYPVKPGINLISTARGAISINVLQADKDRDQVTGEFKGFTVPEKEKFIDGPVLLPDDICDGGGTFIGLADALKEKGIDNPIDLYVSHGIFSKGYAELLKRFRTIHTTDTLELKDKPEAVKVHSVIPQLLEAERQERTKTVRRCQSHRVDEG